MVASRSPVGGIGTRRSAAAAPTSSQPLIRTCSPSPLPVITSVTRSALRRSAATSSGVAGRP